MENPTLFTRIIDRQIPAKIQYEDDHYIVIHDIQPQAPVHVLVIPKGAYVSWDDFSERASDGEIAGFVRGVGKVARDLDLVEQGYRALANVGMHSGQEVPHLHVHIFGGRPLGPMLAP